MNQGGTVTWYFNGDTGEFEKAVTTVRNRARQVGKDVDQTLSGAFASATKKAANSLNSVADSLSGLVKTGAVALAGMGVSLGAFVQTASELETTNKQMGILVGSAKDANKIFGELYNYTLGKPITFPDASKAAKTLLGYGRTQKTVMSDMKTLSTLSIVNGANLQALSLVFGQITSRGALFGQDALQLINNNIPLTTILARKFGISMQEASERINGGKVSADEFVDAMKKYADSLDITSMTNTFQNRMISLKGSIRSMGLALLGIKIDPLKGLVIESGGLFDTLSNSLAEFVSWLKTPEVKQGMAKFGADLTASLKAAMPVVKSAFLFFINHLPLIINLSKGLVVTWVALKAAALGLNVISTVSSAVNLIGTVLKKTALASTAASPVIARSAITLAEAVTVVAQIISKALPAMAMAAAGIALVGLGIGIAIASIGGGIWVFGKGLSSVGQGMKDIADGAVIIQKVNLSQLAKQVALIGMAFTGLAPKIFDLAAAALTFPRIGTGLRLMADGLHELQYVQIDAITQKLPALADALKTFQIGFLESVFSGNILSKFSNLGDALKNIAKVINMVSALKIDSGELKRNLKNLAEGLDAFLIPEFKPGWIAKVFGAGTIEPRSVISYVNNLGEIVKPIEGLQKIFLNKKFDAGELKKNLQNLATGLDAFLIGEVKPSWINSVFGQNTIKPDSVTKYVDNLGDIVKPIQNLQKIFTAKKFKAGDLRDNLTSLATGLKAFTLPELKPSWIEKTLGSGTVAFTSLTDKLKGFGDLVTGLSSLQKLFKSKGFDGKKFTGFIQQLGGALKAFTSKDFEKSISFLGSSSSFKTKTTGTLKYFDSFGVLAQGLGKLNDLLNKKNFDESKFTGFVGSLGGALKAFTITDITKEVSEFLVGGSKISTQTSSILQYFNNFGVLADGIIKLQTLFANKKFQPETMISFLNGIGGALQSFGVTGIKSKVSSFLLNIDEQTTYTSVLEHLGNFKDFASGISTLVNTIFSKNIKFDLSTFTGALSSIGKVLSSFGAYNANYSASALIINESKSISYTNVLEHLGDFANFATGIKTIADVISSKSFKLDSFTGALQAIGDVLNSFVRKSGTIENSALFISNKLTVNYTSVLEHLGNFKNFASGLKIIADVVSNTKFNAATFKTALTAIFDSLKTLALKETEAQKNGWFSSSSSKTSYTSIIQKIGDIQGLANAVKTLSATGVGTKSFNGAAFESAMGSIARGLKSILSISSVDFGSIDTNKLNGVATGIRSIRSAVSGWDTSGLGAKGGQISGFIKTFSSSLVSSITGKAAAMQNAGTQLMSSLAKGLSSGSSQARNTAAQLGSQFISGINSKQNAAKTAGHGLQSAMWNGIQPRMKDEYYQGQALATNLVNGLKTKDGAAKSAGANAVQGFINGANSKNVYSTGWNIANSFLQGLKDRGNQHSPWKTTLQIGDYAMQGLTQGIRKGQGQLVKAADSVASSVLNSFGVVNTGAIDDTIKRGITGASGIGNIIKGNTGDNQGGIENHIGTITIANDVDAESWLQKLTRQDQVIQSGLIA